MSCCIPGCLGCRDPEPVSVGAGRREAERSWSRIRAALAQPHGVPVGPGRPEGAGDRT